jgi:tetratricopeptide (TPR) repeat protein
VTLTTDAPAPPSDRLFTIQEVSRITGATVSMLRHWDRTGLLPAIRQPDGRLRYDFRGLIAARTAFGLLEAGVRAAQVREAIEALRSWRPDVEDPLASLRVFSDGGRLVVRLDGALVEPASGQLLLALGVGDIAQAAADLEGEVVPVEPLHVSREPADAQGWFEQGLAAEGEGRAGSEARAEHRYRRALELDPEHPGALLNLGNLCYHRGDLDAARDLYRRAVLSAPEYAEAHYNLGNVLDDLGSSDAAISAYRESLALAPDFKAAHFNLALVLEKVGDRGSARRHWQAYLRLDAESPSADIARSFLEEDS